MYMFGVMHHFEGIYKEITLFNHNGCSFTGTKDSDATAKVCQKERKALIPLLRNWSQPIDIIIFAQTYTSEKDPPLSLKPGQQIKDDLVFQQMQQFFSTLSDIAKEVVFVPNVHFFGGLKAFNTIYHRKMMMEQSLNVFRTPIDFVKNHRINTRKRVNAIQCEKCLKYDLSDLWCLESEKVCDMVDLERRVSFFTDSHHVNLYGSLFVGKYFRVNYDQWMKDSNSSTKN